MSALVSNRLPLPSAPLAPPPSLQTARTAILAQGGVEAILLAMRAQPSSAETQEHACWAIDILARSMPESRQAIIANGGAKAVLLALRTHAGNEYVAEWSLKALYILASNNPEVKVKEREVGGVFEAQPWRALSLNFEPQTTHAGHIGFQ